MKKMIVVLICLSAFGCKNSKKAVAPTEPKIEKVNNLIMVSRFGGVTGENETYLIKTNGRIFRLYGAETDTTFSCQLAEEQVSSLKEKIAEAQPLVPYATNPGNMNYSMVVYSDNGNIPIQWADQNRPKNKSIITLFDYAFRFIFSCKS